MQVWTKTSLFLESQVNFHKHGDVLGNIIIPMFLLTMCLCFCYSEIQHALDLHYNAMFLYAILFYVIEGSLECITFSLPCNIFNVNMLVLVLEGNLACVRLFLVCNSFLGNMHVFMIKIILTSARFILQYNIFIGNIHVSMIERNLGCKYLFCFATFFLAICFCFCQNKFYHILYLFHLPLLLCVCLCVRRRSRRKSDDHHT